MSGVFVTGTDTGVGKTRIAAALLQVCRERGLRSAAMKPVASGCRQTAEGLRNADAVILQQAATLSLDYETVNPYAFAAPIAPHIAAQQAGVEIDLRHIQAGYNTLAARADCVIVEGAGGWYAPLTAQHSIADLAAILALPVVLVIGMRLGCLNHALLSEAAILASGVPLLGWIANNPQPAMPALQENLRSLQQRMHSPCLGSVDHSEPCDPRADAAQLHLPEAWFAH